MPRTFPRPAVAVLFAALLAAPVWADDGAAQLAAKIDAVINAPEYKHSRWGLLVVDDETGRTVYEHNPDMLFAPASVTKLYTCAAALAALGPDHRFETPVYRRGDVTGGRLHGDLILVGQGDLSFGGRGDAHGTLAFKDHDHIYANWLSTRTELTDTDPLAGLGDLAEQVRASGIKEIDGDVLADDRLFARARGSGSGPDVLTPILVNDNVIDVIVTPAEVAGNTATAEFRPQTGYVQIDAHVDTVDEGKPVQLAAERVGPERFVVRGQIPVGSKPMVRICPVDDPAAFARALFIEKLRRADVSVKAGIHEAPTAQLPDRDAYKDLQRVAVLKSPPLSEAVKVTLKVSHNLYASTLPLLVAAKYGKRTPAEGLHEERRFLADLGVDVDSISLESGAGGGNADRATPRTTVQLLRGMAKRPEWAAYKAALPVLGVDGTLADAVGPDSPARGKVLAKTGTYGDSDLLNGRLLLRAKSLAGVMTTAGGRGLTFAIFLNDVPLPPGGEPGREGKVLGRLCEIIYQNSP
jgi:D-alanyl-D-alanine carboxypeptidase/D-alanyl-D-alanine-endopeptidase (penicillin-binding protein 4)